MTELVSNYYAFAGDCTSPSEMLDYLIAERLDPQLACEIVAFEFDIEETSEEMYELQVRAGE